MRTYFVIAGALCLMTALVPTTSAAVELYANVGSAASLGIESSTLCDVGLTGFCIVDCHYSGAKCVGVCVNDFQNACPQDEYALWCIRVVHDVVCSDDV
jgi:hypothetical protein